MTERRREEGWTDRQLPAGDAVFIDHVGCFVGDLEAAGRRLQRLGFEVGPVNLQMNADAGGVLRPSGTSNRVAGLRFGFIELLAATHETPLADQLRAALARYEGLHLLALSHGDIPGQRARLVADGFAMQDVVELRRHVETPLGRQEIAWSVLRPQPGVMAEGRVQFVKCHTPGIVWPTDRPAPPNAVEGLGDLLCCVADRDEAAGRFGRFAGRTPVHAADRAAVPLQRGRLLFVEPRTLPRLLPLGTPPAVPGMVGQALRSGDLEATRKALARGGVRPLVATEDLLCVGPAEALGCHLLFHRPSLADPWAALGACL